MKILSMVTFDKSTLTQMFPDDLPRRHDMTDHNDLSKNFSRSEFACKGLNCCGGSAPVSSELVDALQKIRDQAGPLVVTSGFRCVKHNSETPNSSPNSRHCLGIAADIKSANMTPQELAEVAEEVLGDSGGIGIYSGWIHVDTRSDTARWG